MWSELENSRRMTLLVMLILIAASAHTCFDGNKGAYSPVSDALVSMGFYVLPLFIIAVALARADRLGRVLFVAWFSILVGGFFEYAYYVSHDPSKGMLLIIGVLSHWVCALVTLSAYSESEP
jgi:hypothetical protein